MMCALINPAPKKDSVRPPELDEAGLERARDFLDEMSRGLFPDGSPDPSLLTWPDAFAAVGAAVADTRSIEERLKSAEARFVTLVEQIPAVTFMAVLGEGENEVYVSPHIETMLGYSQEEWLSDPFLWYTRLHPEDRALWNEEFARGCRTGGPFRAECRFIASDGHIVWVHGEARLVRDERGRPQFLQGVAFDITESKRAQETLLTNAVTRAKHEEEMVIARRVQMSILPSDPALEGLEIAAVTVPADDVGGDYYDVRSTNDGGWIAIGDVSGHGLDAGLIMLMVQSAASAISIARPSTSAKELLVLLNAVLFQNIAGRLAQKQYVTLSVLRYLRSGRVTFAGAHQDILVFRARTGKVERIKTPGPWIGIREQIRTATVESAFELRDGDLVVLYTDGVIEAANAAGDLFDVHRVIDVIERSHAEKPAVIRDRIVQEVSSFLEHRDDDITLIVARYSAPAR
ncbi:MAG TPA: SpoIIE family protein phosphatase [Polyangiaceae bacterium]|jgi:PAS domain S-box-containing protein|nr:SpoIIE family protein phosphatase [Polyangiaceae bacterium]